MTEIITDMESFSDGEPQELKGYEKPARREKTFLEKISTTAGLAAVATLIEMAVPAPVQAENITLRSTQKPENFAVWADEAPSSEGVIYYDVDGKELTIEASVNAPMSFKGRCPTPDSHGNWIPVVETNKGTSYPATVHTDLKGTTRSQLNGFEVDTTSPQIAGDEVTGKVKCVLDNNPKNDAVDKGEDHQDLVFKIASVRVGRDIPHGEAPRVEYVAPPVAEAVDDSTSADENPVWHARGAVADTIPMSGVGDTNNLGVLAAVGVDPVHGGGARNFEIDLIYRSGRVPGEVTDDAGKKHVVDGYTHCGFVGGGWTPELGTELVRGRIAGAIGVCAAEALETDYGRVDGKTSIGVGRGDAGIEVGGKNIGVTGGVDAIVGADSSAKLWGPYIGVYGRW